jgi:regulator of PEP synthase PpsR (kinase-PPPase family)
VSAANQRSYELRRAEATYRSHHIAMINSSAISVEEMPIVILLVRKHG